MPRTMGGNLTIPVCYSCNNARGCSMTDAHFLRFVSTHPETWIAAIRDTRVNKFKDYIGDHPDLNRDPTIRRAMLMMGMEIRMRPNQGKKKRSKRSKTKRSKRSGQIRLYGLRSQKERPTVNREKRRTSRWVARKPKQPHAPFEHDSRQVEITMIRSRIRGALKARLRQLNVMNWEDHEEAMRRLRIERAPIRL